MTHKSIHGQHCICHGCAPAPPGRLAEPVVERSEELSGTFDETGRRRRGWRAGGLAIARRAAT